MDANTKERAKKRRAKPSKGHASHLQSNAEHSDKKSKRWHTVNSIFICDIFHALIHYFNIKIRMKETS
jgi:hypothetical protein